MKKRRIILLLAALSALAVLPNIADAGLININLTHSTATGTGLDGAAILGGGNWNRINEAQATGANALVDSNGGATGLSATDPVLPAGAPQVNGNAVQSEAWGFGVNLTVSGLIGNQIYKVAVYSDREGTGAAMDTYEVNGNTRQLPNHGAAVTALPGTENVDYALFVINASGTGTINFKAPWIAGIQIEGVLPGEDGPQSDARIAAKSAQAGKGDGIYAATPRKSQTLTQKTKKKRPRRFFLRVENDGEEIDLFSLKGSWPKRKANLRVIALGGGGGNVTAKVFAGSYRDQLDENETRQLKITVKPKKKKRGTLKARFRATPSTQAANRSDLVVAETKVRR